MSEHKWVRQVGDVSPDEEHEGNTLRHRASRAEYVIKRYNYLGGDPDFGATNASDLLTDLLHLCDREGWDWNAVLARAFRNYNAETHRSPKRSPSSKESV